jgi:hypothetical protein
VSEELIKRWQPSALVPGDAFDHGFTDLSVTHDMHQQFATATVDARHVITDSDSEPARLAGMIKDQLGSDIFRCSPP